ncbi:uncharacterized protein LOC133176627 isoform X2 [Saccostrea echinata]|uniref:uncharacterized protein LOC133176627 isoform X2 n=1 Tax=Saccostrea echinata TaxID=191078 RepID=UPI002A83BAA4|nr:uncharacterized protein LOC133176627 isoform X2 [Saccostrea echinata]
MVTMENIGCQQCICNDPFLRPPKAPIFGSTSQQAKAEMIKMQDESEVYQSYIELCGNKTYVPVYSKTSSTTAQTTVVPRVTTLKDVTTDFTNITSLQNDTLVPPTSILSSSSADSDGWIVPVVIVIILAFVIAIIAVGVYMYKKKGKAGNITHTYDLQTHESVNYLNNKAEKGNRWSGAHENVNYLDNHAEKGKKWNGGDKNGLEGSGKQGGYTGNLNGTQVEDKVLKKSDNVNYNKNNKELEVSLKNDDSVMNSDHPQNNETKSSLKRKPHGKKEDEAIYANSQFVKVAKADQLNKSANKKPLVDTPSCGTRDISPPVDKKTHEMYYIDENPYDRVDSRKKPVPKKRNKVMQHDPGSK